MEETIYYRAGLGSMKNMPSSSKFRKKTLSLHSVTETTVTI